MGDCVIVVVLTWAPDQCGSSNETLALTFDAFSMAVRRAEISAAWPSTSAV
jgi:hypothetical protein